MRLELLIDFLYRDEGGTFCYESGERFVCYAIDDPLYPCFPDSVGAHGAGSGARVERALGEVIAGDRFYVPQRLGLIRRDASDPLLVFTVFSAVSVTSPE